MTSYTYKLVCFRDDYQSVKRKMFPISSDDGLDFYSEAGERYDGDPNYNGDCWAVVKKLLDDKDDKITDLEEDLFNLAASYD